MIEINGKKVYLLPVIRGLAGEGEKVRRLFYEIKPDCIAITVADEDLNLIGEKIENASMPAEYQYYLLHLSKYGELAIPSQDIIFADEISKKEKVPLYAVDMNDDEYMEKFVEYISLFSLIRYSRKIKRLAKKKFNAKNAEEFVVMWDKEMNSIKSFKRLEEERENTIVKKIVNLCNKYEKLLVIIPFEKNESISQKLRFFVKD
jgi:pheromone shutdown protein TraB